MEAWQQLWQIAVLCLCCTAWTAGLVQAQESMSAPSAPVAAAPDPLAPLPKLAPDHARIFFFRASQLVGMASDAKIELNGVKSGWVGIGSAVFVDHAPGDVVISIGGDKGFAMNLEPGRQYFVALAARAHTLTAGGVPYLMETLLNKDIPQEHCGWNWCAGIFDKQTALPTLENLSISGPNPNAD